MTALFAPFRALGYITENTPFVVQRRGKETFLTVSVGKSWQVYNCAKITLVIVGPQFPDTISALQCSGDLTFAAVGSSIYVCQRAHRVAVLEGHKDAIIDLLVLGNQLLSLGKDGMLIRWNTDDLESQQPEGSIQLPADFLPTCMCHPDTYLNKVVIGAADGRLQLWNFNSGKLVYEFTSYRGSAVCCVVASPALDVVGIGLADGRAAIHNLRFDEAVVVLDNAAGAGLQKDVFLTGTKQLPSSGACTSLAFRTGSGIPLLAAGGTAGVITVWNLEEKRLHTVIKDAHDMGICKLHFFPGEPLLMSGGADNSIKQWIFDNADGTARLLRFRSGHYAPPTRVRFYADGAKLLSAGQDRCFRMFSVIQDQQSRELSQGHTQRRAKRLKVTQEEIKLPPLVALDACEVRERDWCNVLTAHEGDPAAYVWRLQHFTLGEHVLTPPAEDGAPRNRRGAPVTCVAVSNCGNFGLVGNAEGRIDRYNMQSGLHRGSYTRPAAVSGGTPLPAHAAAVRGVSSDSCNRLMVSCGEDAVLGVWDFKKQSSKGQVSTGSPCERMAFHDGSGLAAVSCADHVIRMYDAEAQQLVRRLSGHGGPITDLVFSADSKWLLSSGEDGSVWVWDVPSATVLQVMMLSCPVTSLSLSPRMDLLATAHKEQRGIYLWANQKMFGSASDILPSPQPVHIDMPTPAMAEQEQQQPEHGSQEHIQQQNDVASKKPKIIDAVELSEGVYSRHEISGTPAPLDPELVTLSLLPRTQWHNLLHLDVIKARSRPVAPPKKSPSAPFFLPTIAGLQGDAVFDTQAAAGKLLGSDDEDGERVNADSSSRIIRPTGDILSPSGFSASLLSCHDTGNWEPFTQIIRKMTPSQLDQQLNALQVIGGDEEEHQLQQLQYLMKYMKQQIDNNTNFEFIQALLCLFLRVHAETVMSQPAMQATARQLHGSLKTSWKRLNNRMQTVQCMVALFGNMQQ